MPKKKVADPFPDYVFDVDVYNMSIAVFFSLESADSYFHKAWGEKHDYYKELMADGAQALAFDYVVPDGRSIHGVLFPNMPQPQVIAHECSHLVDMISEKIGMPGTMDTTEPRAYLMQFLFDRILEACIKWEEDHPEWRKSE